MVRTVTLPMKDWPEADKAMWADLTQLAGPLDGNGALAHVRATSLLALSNGYERWLELLMATDPVTLDQPPELRATPTRLVIWLDAMAHLALRTRFTFLSRTVRVLSAAAPEADWSTHRHLLHSLQRKAQRAVSTRKTGRILSSSVLLDAGRKLAGPMADAATTPLAAMRLRRNGTMVAFLALLPIRRRALSELKLGQSVLVTPT
jgi:hypothetical protein